MRIAALFGCAVLLTVHAPGFAAPEKPTGLSAKLAPTFLRGVPLPKWAEPLSAIPASAEVAPVVVRLAETQAWAGPKPVVLVSRAIQVHDKTRLGDIGQYKLTYSPAYQKLSLHRVAILRNDQVIDQTARVGIRVIEREPSLENGFYDGQATVSLLLEDVRVDDTLSITYSIEGRNPVFGKVWADEFMWDSTTPVALRRLVIAYPAGQPLQWRELGDVAPASLQPVIERSGTIERLRFEGKSLPAVEQEVSVPSEFLPQRMIQASEYRSWHEVAVWAAGLFAHGSKSPEVAALARQFERFKTDEERASAALHWVQDEIRYFSVALGENSHRPQPPEVVLKRRYGDCKDKSNLLIALLERLGIHAEPVLVNSSAGSLPQRLLPTPTWFDHVIVRVQTTGGKTWFVDPTRESEKGELSALPVAVPGAAALVASAESNGLVTIPEDTDTLAQLERHERFVIKGMDGDVALESRTRYRGYIARYARQRFRSLSASERKDYLLADYEKHFRGVALVGEPTLHEGEDGTTFDVLAKFSLPKPVRHEDGWYLIDHSVNVIAGSLGIPDKLVRKYPFAMPMGKYRASYRLQIQWPEEVKGLMTDDASTIDNEFFRVHKEYSWRANHTEYALDYEVKRKSIDAAKLPELQAQSRLLEPLVESSLKVHDLALVKPEGIGATTRETDLANMIATIAEFDGSRKNSKNPAELDAYMCEALKSFFLLGDVSASPRAVLQAILKQSRELKAGEQDKHACMMAAAFHGGEFAAALYHASSSGIKDQDDGTLHVAWMRLLEGDPGKAAADVQRFLAAKLKNRTLTPADAASVVALLKRAGTELPRELGDYIAAGPNDVWPRPLLAYQTGRLTQEQLFSAVEKMPPTGREVALNEVWFYVGQSALSGGRKNLALKAFRWVRLNAMRSSVEYTLAKAQLKQMERSDPDYLEGIKAAEVKQYAIALDRFTKAAGRGVAAAQYELGALYEQGRGVGKDEAKAAALYRQAADLGDLDAMNDLGVLYNDGRGVAEDKQAALEWYARAAAFGHYHASRNLGRPHLYGYAGVKRDAAKALPYLHDAAELGNPEAQSLVAEMFADGDGTKKDYARALLWASLAAEQGDVEAKSTLAFMFMYGHGVEEDIPRAIKLYQAAAKEGSVSAQTQLGDAYLNGRGVPKDSREAFKLFSKAMEGGNNYAAVRVGEAYLYGEGTGTDFDKARAILREYTKDDGSFKCRGLGRAYRKDRAGHSGWRKAIEIFRKGAEQGDAGCQLNLAFALQFGRGIPADAAEAAVWYRKAGDQGEKMALNNLADLYEHGNGVSEDIVQAIELYRLAAKKGDATAMLSLGILYEEGKGVALDVQLASVYYQLAAQLGEYRADEAIKRLSKTVGPEEMKRAKATAAEWTESQPLPGMRL